jgi:preprotein translocase subunit SecA
MLRTVITNAIQGHMGEQHHMDAESFQTAVEPFRTMFLAPDDLRLTDEELSKQSAEQLIDLVEEKAAARYEAKEQELGSPLMREVERVVMLRVVDEYWMDNIDAMTELRQGIGLRAYAQTDPIVAYKKEGYEMFEEMIAAIQEETIRRLYLVRVQNNNVQRQRVAKVTSESAGDDGTVKKQPVRRVVKIGRNDPCPCGSGLKWKKCTCPEYHKEETM